MSITDRICRTLDEESARALLLHEEIPDWIDIERRPEKPRPAPRPEKKAATMGIPQHAPQKESLDLVGQAMAKIGRGAITEASVATGLGRNTGGLHRWLKTGTGLSAPRVAKLMEWAQEVLDAEDPGAAVRERWDEARKKMSTAKKLSRAATPQSFADDRAGTEKAKAEIEAPPEAVDHFGGKRVLCPGCRGWFEPGDRCACLGPASTALGQRAMIAATPSPAPPGDAVLVEHLERMLADEIARLAPNAAPRIRARVLLEARV